MKKVVQLNESDIEQIVRGVIKQKNTDQPKTINNLMEEIDSMLDFHYRTNSAFLKHTEDFSDRFNILEDFKTNVVKNIFSNDSMILEKFDKFFNKGVIVESTFDFQEELNGYFNFIKSSLLYQGGFINESQYNDFSLLTEGYFDDAWNAGVNAVKTVGNKVAQGAKYVGNKVVQGAKAVGNAVVDVAKKGYAALQGAWNKLKSLGVGAFMEKFRGFLTSNWGAALQILIEVSTEGFGALIPLIAWAILANYDVANVIAGSPNWFNLLFSIIGTATTGVASKAIGAAMPFFKTAGKAAGSFTQAIEWLAKSKFGQMFKPLVSAISAGLAKVPGFIAKAMTWVKSIFGKVFGEGVVNFFAKGANAIGKFVGEMATGLKNFFTTTVTQGSKKLAAKGVKTVLGKAASLSPKIDAYLLTASGKNLSSKLSIQTVNMVKKELTSTVKNYSEEQALAYIDKKYGKLYGDVLRFAKTVKDTKDTGAKLAKNTKSWNKAGKLGSTDWAATHFKDTVSNTQKLVKNTAKVGELGNKVATEV